MLYVAVLILVYCPELAVCKQMYHLTRGSLLAMLCVNFATQIGKLRNHVSLVMRYTGCGRYGIN